MPVRFLIAEDQRAHQKLLANVVLFLGGESSFASNGIEAIQMATREHFDIVLMDLEMPQLGGLAAADRLLHQWKDTNPRPRIVVVSGNNSLESISLCRVVGMDGFIAKPYSTTALRRSLQEVITRGYCWQDGPTRRLLHLDQLAKVWAMEGYNFEQWISDARASLKFVSSGPAAFAEPIGLETVSLLEGFAAQHGFVKLQAAMARIPTLQQLDDAHAIMSEECADELQDFEQVVAAARAIEVETPVIC